ncbi:MAG: hypothetical protein KDC53_01675, partial [Saprospiraceae bacterium]|nr:hypothetical protein [Saprospiraceae bacterium]
MTNFTKSLLLILFLAIVQIAWGQRFGMGFNSGIILSQLDGDGYTGYDKLGVRLGIRSQAFVSSRMDFIIELNYEAKGSRFEAKHAENPNRKNQYVK